MFRITQGKGFFMTFENGYTLSVQFGYGNYCANRGLERRLIDKLLNMPLGNLVDDYAQTQAKLGEEGSATAEIAVWTEDGEGRNFCGQELGIFKHDTVEGWCTPERVLEVMNIISKLEKSNETS